MHDGSCTATVAGAATKIMQSILVLGVSQRVERQRCDNETGAARA